MAYLYRHVRLDTNEVFYIGISLKDDLNYKRASDKRKRSEFWNKITKKTNYRVDIMFEDNDVELIKEKEKEFIALYGRRDLGLGTLCNLTCGGDGCTGHVHTYEHKVATSERMKGENNPNYGKVTPEDVKEKLRKVLSGRVVSAETREKLSAIRGPLHHLYGKRPSDETIEKQRIFMTGRTPSEETRKKLSLASKGRVASDETKAHFSKIRKGKRMGDENPRSRLVLNKETGIIYYSALEAHRELSLKMSDGHFFAMLVGKYPNKTSCIYI